jgi:hypothetical protein
MSPQRNAGAILSVSYVNKVSMKDDGETHRVV